MHSQSNSGDDDKQLEPATDWLSADDLLVAGHPSELIARLPTDHTGSDGRPCWHRDELPDLLKRAAQEGDE
jgi:hypothetical protein